MNSNIHLQPGLCPGPRWGGSQSSPRLPLLQLLFVVIICGKVSLWLLKIMENSGNFYLLLYGLPTRIPFLILLLFMKFQLNVLLYCECSFVVFLQTMCSITPACLFVTLLMCIFTGIESSMFIIE